MSPTNLPEEFGNLEPSMRMPVVFIGHGSPMNAIQDNPFTCSWADLGHTLPKPQAILSVSAHWLTPGSVQVLATDHPRTIHDFAGFPDVLYEQYYPAPGSPEFARLTVELLAGSHAQPDHHWGLDHGTWSVLKHMYPNADVPVYQLSMDYSQAPRWHFELAQQLAPLRDRGVLVIGSGNIVHNLRAVRHGGEPYGWALEFDDMVRRSLADGDNQAVVDFLELGTLARTAHPTHDHFLPAIYTLGLRRRDESVRFVTDGFDLGSISMRSYVIG